MASPAARPPSSPAYDWLMAATASCMGLGAYIDGWAHNHALKTGAALETFFDPWHALLYGGYGLVRALAATLLYWRARGYRWADAVPAATTSRLPERSSSSAAVCWTCCGT